MKSPNFYILNGEICRKLQNFSKIWSIKTNFRQNRCPIMWKFMLSERHFKKFSYAFYFMKKYCLVLKLCLFTLKFTISGFPLKIVNLPPFWTDVGYR